MNKIVGLSLICVSAVIFFFLGGLVIPYLKNQRIVPSRKGTVIVRIVAPADPNVPRSPNRLVLLPGGEIVDMRGSILNNEDLDNFLSGSSSPVVVKVSLQDKKMTNAFQFGLSLNRLKISVEKNGGGVIYVYALVGPGE
jgi:hypothetical protein